MLSPRQFYTLGSVAVAVAAVLACDPGLHYRPRDWREVADYRWTHSVDGLELETMGTGSLIGSTGMSPEFTVRNRTGSQVQVMGATLRTARGSFESKEIRPGSEKWFTVDTGESKRITVSFRFSEPIHNILVDPVSLTLHILIGGDARDVGIAMRKG